MKSRFASWFFVIVVVIVPITVFGVVKWLESQYQQLPVLGPEGHRVSVPSFQAHSGKNDDSNTINDRIVVANFFFTHCPVVCPKMTKQLKRVQAASGNKLLIQSFSVDPERDSVAQLRIYAHRFGITGNWNLYTGEKTDLYRFARKDLLLVATDGDGGPDDFIHSENLVLIDPERRVRGYYRGTDETEAERLIQDIKKLKKEYQLAN